jgi:hypothetical protein
MHGKQQANYVDETATTPASAGTSFVRYGRVAQRGPLTFQQLCLWDYCNLKSSQCPRGAIVFQIVGSLDIRLLARSVNEVVRRHDCLRTRIVMTDGILEQHVDEPMELDLEVIDLVDLAQDDRETQAKRFLREFAMAGSDLAVASPIAVALIQMSMQEYLLAWAVHHIVADGFTHGLALDEVWTVYSELLQGRQPHLARTPVRYLDYALWQHATHHDWLQKHERYWKDRIARAAPVQWPSRVANDERADAWFEVVGLTPLADLCRVARSARTTPAMVMLTVYAAIIASWCGQRLFTIPVNVAGRHLPEHEHAAGYFAQFLYVGVEITGSETFLELLSKVSGEFCGALMHQDFGKVAAQVPEVLLGSMFSWAPWRFDTFGLPPASIANEIGFTVRRLEFTQPMTQPFEFQGIATSFCAADGEYTAALWYRTDEFSTNTVERFALELRSLCERVVTDPHRLLV